MVAFTLLSLGFLFFLGGDRIQSAQQFAQNGNAVATPDRESLLSLGAGGAASKGNEEESRASSVPTGIPVSDFARVVFADGVVLANSHVIPSRRV